MTPIVVSGLLLSRRRRHALNAGKLAWSSLTVAEQTARRLWHRPGDGVSPAFRRVGVNAIEARLVAKDEEDLAMFFFYLLATLGHATFL